MNLRFSALLFSLFLLSVSAAWTENRSPDSIPDYRVWIWQESGDSLSQIAQKVYGDKTKWNLIYLANKDIIKDPNKIYPKQKLKIPPPDWQPNP